MKPNVVLLIPFMMVLFRPTKLELVQIITPEKVEIVTPETSSKPEIINQTRPERSSINDNATVTDSYLIALRESQNSGNVKRKDPDVIYGKPEPIDEKPYNTLVHSSYVPEDKYPSFSYKPSRLYPSPPQMYGPAAPVTYLPPTTTTPPPSYVVSSPAPVYGPPSPAYGPPVPVYGPPEPSYGTPFSNPGSSFFPMLPMFPMLPKLPDLQMIMKIVLKLVLFKMIVKFFAVLCLLLFIPTLAPKKPEKGDDEEEDDRTIEHLNFLTDVVWDSIDRNSTETDVEDVTENNEIDDDESDEIEEKNEEIVEDIIETQSKDKIISMPSAESAIGFLEFCVSAVNGMIGSMISFLRMRRNDYDVLDKFFMDKFYAFLKRL